MKRSFCVLAGALAFAVAGCGGSDDGSSSGESDGDVPTVKIGRLVPKTGPYVEFAKIQSNAFDLAVEQVNAAGRVKLDVVEADQGGTPPEAVAGYERVKREDPSAVVSNGGSSSQAVAVGAAAGRDGLVQTSAVADPLKDANPNGFNTLPLNDAQLPLATEAFWEQFGDRIRTAAYVSPDDYDLGRESVEYRREFLEDRGVETVLDEEVQGSSRDLTAVASKVAAADPDVVVSDMATNVQPWHQQLSDSGFDGLAFAGATLASTGVTRVAPRAYAGTITFQNWNPGTDRQTATARSFVRDFEAKYGVEPDGFAAAQYDGVLMLAAAAEATGSSDPGELAEWIRSNEGPEGVTMERLRFTDGQGLASPVYLTRINPNGSQTPIAVVEQPDA